MSPYRVLAKDRNDRYHVLVSQLKKDKNIYIYERFQNETNPYSEPLTAKELAHKPISKSNSTIVSHYLISADADEIHYRVLHVEYESTRALPELFILQSDCLVGAIEHFCLMNQYNILDTL